jgi:5'-nucleotidase
MNTHRILLSLFASTLLGLGPQAHADEAPEPAPPLRILLTNDDGVAAPGLLLLRDTLCAAGHQVFISAPSGDRSGSSAALGLNVAFRVTRTEFPCGATVGTQWAVGGTPSDSVLFGLRMLGAERPDVVISGMNLGQNTGRAVNHSGTVGAAVTAAEEGVPSIAVSIGLNFQDAGTGFSQTVAAVPHAAEYVKELIAQLRDTARPGEGLLPDRVALNVNYPVVLGEDGLFDPALVQDERVTTVGHAEVVRPTYTQSPTQPDVYIATGPICGLSVACDPETQRHADTTALAEGAISVSPLVVDEAFRPLIRAQLHWRLNP